MSAIQIADKVLSGLCATTVSKMIPSSVVDDGCHIIELDIDENGTSSMTTESAVGRLGDAEDFLIFTVGGEFFGILSAADLSLIHI